MTGRFRPRIGVATMMALVAAVALGLAGARSAGAYRRCVERRAWHERGAAEYDRRIALIDGQAVRYGGEEIATANFAAIRDYHRAMGARWAEAAPWAMLGLEPEPDPPPPAELTPEELLARRSATR